jgi:Amt family ammonium transporter
VVLGTGCIWFGWLGFNGGSARGANLRAVTACIATNVAAATGGLTGLLIEFYRYRRWSIISWCAGAVAGLVAITPGAGFVPPWSAIIIGMTASLWCYWWAYLRTRVGVDDPLDIFALHGMGGVWGNIMTYAFV